MTAEELSKVRALIDSLRTNLGLFSQAAGVGLLLDYTRDLCDLVEFLQALVSDLREDSLAYMNGIIDGRAVELEKATKRHRKIVEVALQFAEQMYERGFRDASQILFGRYDMPAVPEVIFDGESFSVRPG